MSSPTPDWIDRIVVQLWVADVREVDSPRGRIGFPGPTGRPLARPPDRNRLLRLVPSGEHGSSLGLSAYWQRRSPSSGCQLFMIETWRASGSSHVSQYNRPSRAGSPHSNSVSGVPCPRGTSRQPLCRPSCGSTVRPIRTRVAVSDNEDRRRRTHHLDQPRTTSRLPGETCREPCTISA